MTEYVLVTDLDGTLIRRDGTVSQRTRELLAHSGVPVVFATGRPPRWLEYAYAATGIQPVTVAANGAVILEQDGTPSTIHAISTTTRTKVHSALYGVRPDFIFREEIWAGHILKMLAIAPRGQQHEADAMLRLAWERIGHLVQPTHSAFGQLLLEMGPLGVTKASAMADIRRRWPGRRLVAVGDMPNDADMLRSADMAFRIASGHPNLAEVTSRSIPGPEEDGVASLLELLAGHEV